MKRLRALCLVILLISVGAFGYCKVKQLRSGDNLAPVIYVGESNIEVSVEDGEDILLQGVTAEDRKDGDVTGSVIVENVSGFLDDGRRIVTYAAFDSDNHVSKATRQITYKDYTSPRFEINAPLRFPAGTTNFLSGIAVTDCLDGDLSSSVRFSRGYEITTDEPGNYRMQLEVANSAGDMVYLPVTVEVYDPSEYSQTPQILLKEYIKYVKKGQTLDAKDYLDSVEIAGTEYKVVSGGGMTESTVGRDEIKMIDSEIDYKTPGVYEAIFSMTSEFGQTGMVRMVVVVEE